YCMKRSPGGCGPATQRGDVRFLGKKENRACRQRSGGSRHVADMHGKSTGAGICLPRGSLEVAGVGFEPTTSRLWALPATGLLHPAIIDSNRSHNGTLLWIARDYLAAERAFAPGCQSDTSPNMARRAASPALGAYVWSCPDRSR